MNDNVDVKILDVTEAALFDRLPACADPRFDHRSCDYWENGVRGSKASRPAWWQRARTAPKPAPRPRSDNPFAPPPRDEVSLNPFDPGGTAPEPEFNPFAPAPELDDDAFEPEAPSKLRLLDRGRRVFGSYAKVLMLEDEPAVYGQFGPLSAYPAHSTYGSSTPACPAHLCRRSSPASPPQRGRVGGALPGPWSLTSRGTWRLADSRPSRPTLT